MASLHPDAIARAVELGATEHREGINWCWCSGFPTHEAAEQFDKWCMANGYETRGVYGPYLPGETTSAVRFRKDSDIVW